MYLLHNSPKLDKKCAQGQVGETSATNSAFISLIRSGSETNRVQFKMDETFFSNNIREYSHFRARFISTVRTKTWALTGKKTVTERFQYAENLGSEKLTWLNECRALLQVQGELIYHQKQTLGLPLVAGAAQWSPSSDRTRLRHLLLSP